MSSPKKSFRLKANNKGILELVEISKRIFLSDEDKETIFAGETTMDMPQDSEARDDEEVQIYKELKLKLSSFQSTWWAHPLILVVLRFIICIISIYLGISMFSVFSDLVHERAASDQKDQFIGENPCFRFGAEFVLTSIKVDRGIILTFLVSLFPLFDLIYGYFIAFIGSLYVLSNGSNDAERKLWTEKVDENRNRQLRKHKRYLWCRMENCSIRMDCVLAYAVTPLILNFLSLFNDKTIPHLPIYNGLLILFLVLLDEILMKKRKFELDAIFRMFWLNGFMLIVCIFWILIIR